MSRPGAGTFAEPYSPQRRTALLLTGVGTAGAYHAGVLKAIHEAGIKLDVVGGRGIGAIGALFAAVDGGARLWDDNGFWRQPVVAGFYGWQRSLRILAGAIALALVMVGVPLAIMAVGLVVFPIDFLLKMVGVDAGGGLVGWYLWLAQVALSPAVLPTWLPRLVLITLAVAAVTALVIGWLGAGDRRSRGPVWWLTLAAPLSTASVVAHAWAVAWTFVRGAGRAGQPPPADVARRYVEILSENLGQPGFRELVIAVHDVDAHRDLIFALVDADRRRESPRATPGERGAERPADVQDLTGASSVHLADAIAAALAVPLVTDFRSMRFSPDSYWRGETHRLADRPGGLSRLIDELVDQGVTQIVLVSAAPAAPGPHALKPRRLDMRGRIGEYVQSAEVASVRDAVRRCRDSAVRLYVIQPSHNPVGPFDFTGAFDDRSDRPCGVGELLDRGYEDAHLQFIEPVVGASGERLTHSKLRI